MVFRVREYRRLVELVRFEYFGVGEVADEADCGEKGDVSRFIVAVAMA